MSRSKARLLWNGIVFEWTRAAHFFARREIPFATSTKASRSEEKETRHRDGTLCPVSTIFYLCRSLDEMHQLLVKADLCIFV
jgi:hypothetical protein